ncbi:MAG: DNA-binding protein [Clostridia bacterium]|nr:DNA-binding protein [Clostridia bacterium]
MTDIILGLDTSNYKTSAAFYSPESGEWQSVGRTLDVKEGSLGLRQSDALFLHVKNLPDVIAELNTEGKRICAVSFSDRPRDLPESYMPCFTAGASLGRSLASILNVPFKSFSHQEGHIASAAFSCGKTDLLKGPFYAWHLSGGTTELLRVNKINGRLKCVICGGTTDISAGQLIDRTGVTLGMPFPSGPFVEKSASESDSDSFFKVKVSDGYFSLSGVENKILQMKAQGVKPEDICAFALNTVSFAVRKATEQAAPNGTVLISGGVSACSFVKSGFKQNSNVYFAENGLGGDNALGAALMFALSEDRL